MANEYDVISGSAQALATQLNVQALGGMVVSDHGKFVNLPIKAAGDDSGAPTNAESAYILGAYNGQRHQRF